MHESTHVPGVPDETGRSSPWDDYRVSTQVLPERRPRSDGFGVRQRNASLRALGPVVYAARCTDGVIKIGFTTNLAQRRWGIGSAELLAFEPGTLADEQALHDRLAEHVHHGREWYYPTPGVLAVVNEMRERLGLEPVA